MNYSDKLKDPRWQKKRLEILSRDNFTCQACGNKEITLHVHHLAYTRGGNPWDMHNEALQTLCEDCHSIEHYDGFTDLERELIVIIQFSTCKNLRPAREIAKNSLLKYIKQNPIK